MVCLLLELRQKIQINNTVELITNGKTGDVVYLVSRGKNQFLQNREMHLGFDLVN